MPKCDPRVEKAKAQEVSKSFIENGMNGSAVARKRGTTPQNENKKRRRKIVQDCLTEFLDSPDLKQALIEVGIDGLKSEKSISAVILVDKDGKMVKADEHGGIMIKDQHARHKFWRDLMKAIGALEGESEKGISNVIINIVPAGNKGGHSGSILHRDRASVAAGS